MLDKKVLLIILDGWGIAPAWGGNSIEMAETPYMDELWRKYPHTELGAAEEAVGLTRHEPGNSEVGHLNIGSGQVVYQNLPGINATIKDGSFFKNQTLIDALNHTKINNSNLHLLGLVSDGGIHSSIDHLYALLKMAKERGVTKVYIHMITDGRDTDPMKALSYVSQLKDLIKLNGFGKIVSVMGRFYAMDRDKHFERIEKAYDVLVSGIGPKAESIEHAISESYRNELNDEFIIPTIIEDKDNPYVPITDNDAVIFYNYRGDRSRELTEALTYKIYKSFHRKKVLQNLYFATFAFVEEYINNIDIKTVFHLHSIKEPLAKVIADHNLKQLHMAETEKYAHVTYFFNGGREEPFPQEERIMIPSPRVATYDLQPKMSSVELGKTLINNLHDFSFIVCNFANLDMVGHTANIRATVKACEAVNDQLEKIVPKAIDKNYTVIITGDHGNAEEMINPKNNEPFTEHTINKVPFILCGKDTNDIKLRQGNLSLSDIAPTILKLLNIEKPAEMTGESIVE